jgi:uncharacterized membrane protein
MGMTNDRGSEVNRTMWHQPYQGPFDHTPWWAPFQTILPLLLLVALVGVVVWLIVRSSRQPVASAPGLASPAPRPDAALEHARMRYAQGQIDRDRFLRITQDLSGAEPGGPTAEPPPSLEP